MSNFVSVDFPRDFEIHDSLWTLRDIADGEVTLAAERLIFRAEAPQNPFGCDMELESARVTLCGIRILRGCFYDFSGEIACTASEAGIRLLAEAEKGFRALGLERRRENRWFLTGTNEIPYFEAEIAWELARVECDSFLGPAWYVKSVSDQIKGE